MLKNTGIFTYASLLLFLVGLSSCAARKPNTSGDLYYTIEPIVKLEKLSYRIYLFGHSKNDSNYFPVIFMMDRAAKGTHFKLSHIKISLKDVTTGDTVPISQPVSFCHHLHKADSCHREKISAAALRNDRSFDIKENTLYGFQYTFDATPRILTDPVMQLDIRFDLEQDGKTQTVQKTYLFKKNPHFMGFVHLGKE